MNRNAMLTITLVTLVLCACPGLLSGAFSGVLFVVDPQDVVNQGRYMDPPLDADGEAMVEPALWVLRGVTCVLGLLGLAIPIILGVITLRMARKEKQSIQEPDWNIPDPL